jgi:putative membrane-bound dehydrogenase-like protein
VQPPTLRTRSPVSHRIAVAFAVLAALGSIQGSPRDEDEATVGVAPRLRVPDGFVVEEVARAPDVIFPMFACFDDCGRLYVAESSGLDLYAELVAQTRRCRVRVLDDPDPGSVRYRRSRVFAKDLVFPMGLAWRAGKLFVADPPDLVVLEDTDGDGSADRRSVVLTGFGHTDNGSLHGLAFGPDDLLYMTMGSPDGYRLARPGLPPLEGRSGALIRCRPDGSEPEVLSRGFVNLVEVVFTPRGDSFGTDNWYQEPAGGLRDALVHLVDGGLYPYEPDRGTSQPVTGEALPPLALYPAVALSGLARIEGDELGQSLRGSLLSAQHNSRRVVRHRLIERGATFESDDSDLLSSDDPDFHPSDVLVSADGSILVVDTGSWYIHHCPTGQIRASPSQGGIWRIRPARWSAPDDPWGLELDWTMAARALAAKLADPRSRVRDRAQAELARPGMESIAHLAAILESDALSETKQLALWTLSRIGGDASLAIVRAALSKCLTADDTAGTDIAITAARVLGLHRDRDGALALAQALASPSAPLRLAAAEALARAGDEREAPRLWLALESAVDRFEEHAIILALHHLSPIGAMEDALRLGTPRARRAALVLLDQDPRPRGALRVDAVIGCASAQDGELRAAAIRVLTRHPEWSGDVTKLLPSLSGVAIEDIVAAFARAAEIAELARSGFGESDARLTIERRIAILRGLARANGRELPAAWSEVLARGLGDEDVAIRRAALRAATVLEVRDVDPELVRIAGAAGEADDLRLDALLALAPRRADLDEDAFAFIIGRLEDRSNPLARLAAAAVIGRSRLDELETLRVLDAVRSDPLIAPETLRAALSRSETSATAGRIAEYFAAARENTAIDPAEARARLAALERLLEGGKPERGRAIFFGAKAACSTCHRVGAEGGIVGPDLTRIGTVRAGRDIIESIVYPSASIAQGMDSYTALTADGTVLTGTIARQDADGIVLRGASGAELRVSRSELRSFERQETSLMPDGLDGLLGEEELRDLLAYLRGLE